jgi:ribosome-associated toxin RatA of RatAB toxin-antitoxin module
MTAVTRDIVFEVPIDVAYAVITDFASYPKFLKDMTSVKIIKTTQTTAEVAFHLSLFKDIDYTLRFTLKSPTSVRWKLKSSKTLRKNVGSWTLKKLDATTTEASYALDVEMGLLLPGMISKMLVAQSLPGTLKAFKSRMESLYAKHH